MSEQPEPRSNPEFCTGQIFCSCHSKPFANVNEFNAAHPRKGVISEVEVGAKTE